MAPPARLCGVHLCRGARRPQGAGERPRLDPRRGGAFGGHRRFASEYAQYASFTSRDPLPGGIAAAWYASWFWYPLLGLATIFPPLLFPNGRPVSRRWRPLAWAASGAIATSTVLAALNPRLELHEGFAVANPIGVEAVGNIETSLAGGVLFTVFGISIVASVASLIVRFRRSRGEERQQLKWFTYGGALLVLVPLVDLAPGGLDSLSNHLFVVAVAWLPVSAGIAILRYRLYDIDVVIRRTFVYGLLTAVLAGAYVGTVLLLQLAFSPVTEGSSLAVAGSTLAVAALFRPARRRVQQVVDRRFFRRRYDAERTLAAFSARLRDEVDLDALHAELVSVVRETMQPGYVSLWLREAGR